MFWDCKRQEYTIQNTALSPQRLVVPLTTIEVQPVEWHWIHTHPYSSRKTAHDCSQYTAELLTWMDASISQDIIDLTIPTKWPKISPDSNSTTVSEQLHLLTTQVNQLRINSKQALEQTKPQIQTFPLANIKQFQHLHAVQHQVAQLFVDLNSEKSERLKLRTTFCQLENELTQLRRQVIEPSYSSLPVPFTANPQSTAAFQDSSAQAITRPRVTITLKRNSSTASRSQLTQSPHAPPINPNSN